MASVLPTGALSAPSAPASREEHYYYEWALQGNRIMTRTPGAGTPVTEPFSMQIAGVDGQLSTKEVVDIILNPEPHERDDEVARRLLNRDVMFLEGKRELRAHLRFARLFKRTVGLCKKATVETRNIMCGMCC